MKKAPRLPGARRAANGARGLIDRIEITRGERKAELTAMLHGQLAPLFVAAPEQTGAAGASKWGFGGSGGPLPSKTYLVAIPLQLGRRIA